MTLNPVLPPVVLSWSAAVVIALRLLTMRRLHATAGARWSTVLRWSGLTLAVLLILIAAGRPGIERGEREERPRLGPRQHQFFFIVDRSADTAIEDYGDGQSRMTGIRNDIAGLIDQYPHARFALIAFASRPSLDWPLSEDAWSLRAEVATPSPYPASETNEDLNAAAAANVLRYQLIAAGQQYPGSKSLVYYFGSGAGDSGAPQGEFDPSAGSVDGGAVFGYGAGRRAGSAPDRRAARSAIRPSRRRPARRRSHPGRRRIAAVRRYGDAIGGRRPHRTLLGVHIAGRGAAAVRAVRRHPRCPSHTAGAKGRGVVNRARKPSRLVLRRRLVLFSAPVTLVALLAAAKMISVVVAGNAAVTNYRDGDTEALSGNTSVLNVLNVIEPAKAPFASGARRSLQGRLDEAEARFSEALALTDAGQSCPVLVNLELVRERRGDIDGWDGRRDQARERYRSALDIVRTAPPGCFENNTDPDPERRAVRDDAAARLAAKTRRTRYRAAPRHLPLRRLLHRRRPLRHPLLGAAESRGQRGHLGLDPGAGDPNDKLRQILQDAAG